MHTASKPVGVHLERLAVPIQRAHANRVGALYGFRYSRDGQATLFAKRDAVPLQYLRVDETIRCVLCVGDIKHEYPLVHVDLRRGESYARSGIHRLEHVVDEPANVVIDGFDGRRGDPQPRIRVFQYLQQRHHVFFIIPVQCYEILAIL